MLMANYHTHTPRCHHAVGSEREYIESALQAGLKILGFSDHAPYFFKEGYHSGPRMELSELEGYVTTLTDLRREYAGQLDIRIGLETEYYPAHFEQLMTFLKDYPLDYLILGQHFLNNEYDGAPSPQPTDDPERLKQYVQQVCAGLESGKFAYVAHPDMLRFEGDDEVYRREMTPLCETAKRLNIPLEINFQGYSDKRHYPSERFFKLAGEVGNTVVFGCDAHSPQMLNNPAAFEGCSQMAARYGLTRTEEIRMTMRP